MNQKTYIKTVIVLFGLLILSRIPEFLRNGLSPLILISSIVELIFILWGIAVIKTDQ